MGSAKKKASDPGIQRVLSKELREYLKLPVDRELSRPGKDEVRILPDGRVLRNATTWPSREEYIEWWRRSDEECAKARSAPHPTVALLPPIDDFLRDVEAHARSLGPRLRIPDEALDGSVASLGAVDKALKRIPWVERPVADLVTPLVAYVGEVMRKASGGRWIKPPPTYTGREPVYDPAELAAYQAALAVHQRAFTAAQQKWRGRSTTPEMWEAARKAMEATGVTQPPKPIRFEVKEYPSTGPMNEPLIMASHGRGLSFQPFALVFIPMVEPSKRLPLRAAVETNLIVSGYRPAPQPAA
jgi:hypothetical protein